MTLIASKRLQQAVFEAATSANRGYGSGGGSGAYGLVSLGSFTGTTLGNYATANGSTWTDITGSSFTVQVNRSTPFLYLVSADCETNTVNYCYIRGNIVSFDTTLVLSYSGQGPFTGMAWYYPNSGVIQPGMYTVKLQAATDAGATITVDRATHQFLWLG